jgi:formylmethanofuran dehydrogenase subunit A
MINPEVLTETLIMPDPQARALSVDSGEFNTILDSLSITKMPYACDITSCHIYLYNSHLMFYCYCGLSANSFE